MRRVTVDPARPSPEALAVAADALRRGGVVAMPTDTLYGLAADPFDERAVAAVFRLKGRPDDRAVPLVAADPDQVTAWVGALGPIGQRLASRFWPGPLTLLLRAPSTLAPAVSAGTGQVGVRVPAHAVTRALCAAAGRPLTATSANRSGQPPTADPAAVALALPDVDVLLDAGSAPGGPPSSIVDVGGERPTLVRPGAVAWEEILACLVPS